MGVIQRDAEATAATLTRWLAQVAGVHEPSVTGVSIPGSTGWSNETILFDAAWGLGDERSTRELVARIAPSGHRVFPDDTFRRQHAVMHALGRRSDVPMARIRWLEPDPGWFGQPFWIMDRVAGDIATDMPSYAGEGWLHDAAPEQQAQAWNGGIEAMASVHRVDLGRLALPVGTFPDVEDTVGWHLDHCERFLAWAEDGHPHEGARRALERLHRNRPPEPAGGPALVWGDARLSNLVYRDFDVAAVLDWEMSSIGDPLLDLGWWLFADWALTRETGCPRLPGFPPDDDTARRWTTATGRSTAALGWYEVYAGLRFTVIMLRMGKLLTGMGLVPPEFAYDNLISRALAELLDRGRNL